MVAIQLIFNFNFLYSHFVIADTNFKSLILRNNIKHATPDYINIYNLVNELLITHSKFFDSENPLYQILKFPLEIKIKITEILCKLDNIDWDFHIPSIISRILVCFCYSFDLNIAAKSTICYTNISKYLKRRHKFDHMVNRLIISYFSPILLYNTNISDRILVLNEKIEKNCVNKSPKKQNCDMDYINLLRIQSCIHNVECRNNMKILICAVIENYYNSLFICPEKEIKNYDLMYVFKNLLVLLNSNECTIKIQLVYYLANLIKISSNYCRNDFGKKILNYLIKFLEFSYKKERRLLNEIFIIYISESYKPGIMLKYKIDALQAIFYTLPILYISEVQVLNPTIKLAILGYLAFDDSYDKNIISILSQINLILLSKYDLSLNSWLMSDNNFYQDTYTWKKIIVTIKSIKNHTTQKLFKDIFIDRLLKSLVVDKCHILNILTLFLVYSSYFNEPCYDKNFHLILNKIIPCAYKNSRNISDVSISKLILLILGLQEISSKRFIKIPDFISSSYKRNKMVNKIFKAHRELELDVDIKDILSVLFPRQIKYFCFK
ncbi:hypothetical protein TCON_0582 [Astathelohania contejeani]|uniref:Uncharacterized protein n=1 Tax=Astathelohania contejeani TaxID=164912 RepID=A0ABQ7I180_9MICR|nr:hypothetical protein TCON_0582 [Thelohania contejeani]